MDGIAPLLGLSVASQLESTRARRQKPLKKNSKAQVYRIALGYQTGLAIFGEP